MAWWQILLILLLISGGYIAYISVAAKKRRRNIFYSIIRDAYLHHEGDVLSLDSFHYEAAEKFVKEHGGHLTPGRAAVCISLPVLDNEELILYVVFNKDYHSNNTILTVEDAKKAQGDILKSLQEDGYDFIGTAEETKKANKGVARINVDTSRAMYTEIISPKNNVLEKRKNGNYSESAIQDLSSMYEDQGYRVVVNSLIQRDKTKKEFFDEELEKTHNKEIAIKKFKKAGLTFEEADYLAQDIAELSLYADSNLFAGEEDNAHSIEEAYKDKYYMSTINQLLSDNLPIKDIAYTGIQARAMGLNFELRTAMKKSVFDYLEREELDNTHFKEVFMQTLNTVQKEENTKDVSPILSLLYVKGWILTEDTNEYDESISMMTEQVGVEQALANFQTLFQEGKEWHHQVSNPESQLQKITSLSLTWMGGRLQDIKMDMLNQDLVPLDILLNTSIYQEDIYDALLEAENLEDFPKMDNNYRREVAGRFLQYMQEEKRLDVLISRGEQADIDAMQHIIERLNKVELDYSDIADVYRDPIIGDSALTLEINNEENFSLVYDNAEDMQMAQDLINYKRNVILSQKRKEYFDEIGLDELLHNFKKMSFGDFISQYELDNEQIDAVYSWDEKNDEADRENKIVDFSGYDLTFFRGAHLLGAIVTPSPKD